MLARAAEVAPVEVAPVEVAPVEVAPVEVAPVEVAPVEVAPLTLGRTTLVPAGALMPVRTPGPMAGRWTGAGCPATPVRRSTRTPSS
jgi:hypothetical protein